MLQTLLAKALDFWIAHQLQDLLRPFLVLSSISAMFWMLAHLASFCVFVMKTLLPEEISTLLSILYSMVLAVVYAAMMFHTALLGQWHPSLLWREAAGFVFMYVMLGVTFTDRKTKHLYPYAQPAFFLGLGAYLFLAVVPALVRRPALVEFHRVLELFAAGGWGVVMTAFTVLLMVWSLVSRIAYEITYSLSPLLYKLGLIRAPMIRFSEGGADGARRIGVIPSLRRALVMLIILLGGTWAALYWWDNLLAGAAKVGPAIQSRAQSPEAAAAAAKLKRVLPEVSFTAVRTLARRGPVAEFAKPVFQSLLAAPAEGDRLLAAAALDRMDPSFHITAGALFRSTETAAQDCSWAGQRFQVLTRSLPGDDPSQTRTYWVSDERGLHYSGVGPGAIEPLAGSSACAVAVHPAEGGAVLLAFAETVTAPAATTHLWLAAYNPGRREVVDAGRVGENRGGDFGLSPLGDGVSWADAPASTGAAVCRADCGKVRGTQALSLTTKPLVEYRSAAVRDGGLKTFPEPGLTYARSGLRRFFENQGPFQRAFRFDPGVGFLNRWYRLAQLADGRECISVALDPTLPGWEDEGAWLCRSEAVTPPAKTP
ncbi:MAG: hypothetical protein HY926_04720 [Elusimicrobia bacterium]|nr:hypothetical protein [Elusimicrobiota bacterium]